MESLLLCILLFFCIPASATELEEVFTGRHVLVSKGFPSLSMAYNKNYTLDCPYDNCFFKLLFTDLDLPPGSQIKIIQQNASRVPLDFTQPNSSVSDFPVTYSDSGHLTVYVKIMAPSQGTAYVGFRMMFQELSREEHRTPLWRTKGCPQYKQGPYGVVQMVHTSEGGPDRCTFLLKGYRGCPVYLLILEGDTGVQGIVHQTNTSLSTQKLYLRRATDFTQSPGDMFVQVRVPSGHAPGSFMFKYGCYERQPYSRNEKCHITSLPGFTGVNCFSTTCFLSAGTACDGTPDCPGLGDEISTYCGNRTVTTTSTTPVPATPEQTMPPPLPTLPIERGPETTTTIDLSEPGVPAKDEPTRKRAPTTNGHLIYTVYTLVPLLILILIGCVYYRLTLGARNVFGQRFFLDAAPEPPTYSEALTHPKPEVHPLSTLPSYEQSVSDQSPAYTESSFSEVQPGGETSSSCSSPPSYATLDRALSTSTPPDTDTTISQEPTENNNNNNNPPQPGPSGISASVESHAELSENELSSKLKALGARCAVKSKKTETTSASSMDSSLPSEGDRGEDSAVGIEHNKVVELADSPCSDIEQATCETEKGSVKTSADANHQNATDDSVTLDMDSTSRAVPEVHSLHQSRF